MLICAFRGYFEFMGIFRVYGDISSCHFIGYHILHYKIMTVSHVTHPIFHGDFAQTITNVRKVEMYENKLVLNCGQFYTLFSLCHDRKNYSGAYLDRFARFVMDLSQLVHSLLDLIHNNH